MLETIGRKGSLRFWIAVAMTLAVLPLVISAVAGYLVFDRLVIASFQDVATRQREQIDPTQRLRLLLWDTLVPIDEYVDQGDARRGEPYRDLRQRIEAGFGEVHRAMREDAEPRLLVERALEDWTAADRLATETISVHRAPGDPEAAALMDRFHGLIASSVDKLGAIYEGVAVDMRRDHDSALLFLERSRWTIGITAAVSLLTILAAVVMIGRLIAASVDRLVAGAERFASGDRDHRIEIQVPPELHRVAAEFNRMIGRIRDSEEALSDLARRDGLTRLLNRRAFDEALGEAFERMQRMGEPAALLMLDLDHFKGVNDRYGHAAGDDVLRAVSKAMATHVRSFDRVFRVGGEEFAVLLTGTDTAEAEITGQRLRKVIEAERIPVEGGEIAPTVSIGVATASDVSELKSLVAAADAALYRAKSEGRNRVVVGSAHAPAAAGSEAGC